MARHGLRDAGAHPPDRHRAAFTPGGEPDGWSDATGAPPWRGWVAMPIEELLEGARPDARRHVRTGPVPEALEASTVEVPLLRGGPAPSDGAAAPPLVVVVEQTAGRDRRAVVFVETPAGRQRRQIAAEDLVRRTRKLWAYPVVVLAWPFAVAFDVTLGAAIVAGAAAFESRAEHDRSEAAVAADQDGSGLCGRCQQEREDRAILK